MHAAQECLRLDRNRASQAPERIARMGLEWAWRSLYDASRAGLIARHGLRFLKELAIPPRADVVRDE